MISVLLFVALAIFMSRIGGPRVAIGVFLVWSLPGIIASPLPLLVVLLLLKGAIVTAAFLLIDRFEDTIVLSLGASLVGALIAVSVPEMLAGLLFNPGAKLGGREGSARAVGHVGYHLPNGWTSTAVGSGGVILAPAGSTTVYVHLQPKKLDPGTTLEGMEADFRKEAGYAKLTAEPLTVRGLHGLSLDRASKLVPRQGSRLYTQAPGSCVRVEYMAYDPMPDRERTLRELDLVLDYLGAVRPSRR